MQISLRHQNLIKMVAFFYAGSGPIIFKWSSGTVVIRPWPCCWKHAPRSVSQPAAFTWKALLGFWQIADFCGQRLDTSAGLDELRQPERPSDCAKGCFAEDRRSIVNFRWRHQRHICIRAADMGSMFRQYKSFHTLQNRGFMVEAGSSGGLGG